VRFSRFERPIRPKHHLSVLGPLLASEQKAPLRPTGDGQQHIYLTSVSPTLSQVLIGLAGPDAQVFAGTALQDVYACPVERELVGQQEWEDLEQRRIAEADLPATTRTALVKARIGQGLFKERVHRLEHACRLTMVTNPTHLVGSHIKPWRESTNEERLSGASGLLLTPTADHLFDRGFISFADDGEVLIALVADRVSLKRMGLDPDARPRPVPFSGDQKHFLAHHRKEVFLGAE
jgi:putative restriction endonuclease